MLTLSSAFVCDNPWQAWADSLGPSKCDSNPSIGCTGSATIATIVAHIEHIKRVAGVESVGFGADYDGIGVVPSDASSVASYPAVVKVPVPRTLPP
jgi:microsomal dipeptidase-like Zn-dependent dipeptidase